MTCIYIGTRRLEINCSIDSSSIVVGKLITFYLMERCRHRWSSRRSSTCWAARPQPGEEALLKAMSLEETLAKVHNEAKRKEALKHLKEVASQRPSWSSTTWRSTRPCRSSWRSTRSWLSRWPASRRCGRSKCFKLHGWSYQNLQCRVSRSLGSTQTAKTEEESEKQKVELHHIFFPVKGNREAE